MLMDRAGKIYTTVDNGSLDRRICPEPDCNRVRQRIFDRGVRPES